MKTQQMARLHAAAFSPERGWQPEEFENLLASSKVHLFERAGGFALVQVVADEAELLTLAVDPVYQRRGIATTLMNAWMTSVKATEAFLEVAADNAPAQALYHKHGFAITGRRARYYRRPDGSAVDAVLMRAALTHRQNAHLPHLNPKTG